LQSLQDNVPPFKSPSVESIIEAALGRFLHQVQLR